MKKKSNGTVELIGRDRPPVKVCNVINGKPKAKRIIKDGEGKTPTEIAPGTKVYELVEELAKYLPEEIIKKLV